MLICIYRIISILKSAVFFLFILLNENGPHNSLSINMNYKITGNLKPGKLFKILQSFSGNFAQKKIVKKKHIHIVANNS